MPNPDLPEMALQYMHDFKVMNLIQYALRFEKYSDDLYALTHAAHTRLSRIRVSDDRLMYAVEKDEVLSLLNEMKEITKKFSG